MCSQILEEKFREKNLTSDGETTKPLNHFYSNFKIQKADNKTIAFSSMAD
jgi:hypothetical protein